MSRSHKSRRDFKVDTLLEKISARQKDTPSSLLGSMPAYMNLTFLGFYDKTLDCGARVAQVETFLVKLSHKKRKDSSAALMQISCGTAEVLINPSEEDLPPLAPTVTIATESFAISNGPLAKSFILLLRVRFLQDLINVVDGADDEPALKKRKSNNVFEESKLYGSELIIYDKHNRCLLSNGDYEVVLQVRVIFYFTGFF